jgi:hypothetical protein
VVVHSSASFFPSAHANKKNITGLRYCFVTFLLSLKVFSRLIFFLSFVLLLFIFCYSWVCFYSRGRGSDLSAHESDRLGFTMFGADMCAVVLCCVYDYVGLGAVVAVSIDELVVLCM